MKRTAILLLALAALAIGGSASAQAFRVNGGIDVQPTRPELGFTVTVERPSFDLLSVRWGPIGTLKGKTDFHELNIELLTGVGGAAVLPGVPWAIKIKLLLHTQLQTGKPLSIGPDIQVTFSTQF